jgi:hypothetical protein
MHDVEVDKPIFERGHDLGAVTYVVRLLEAE